MKMLSAKKVAIFSWPQCDKALIDRTVYKAGPTLAINMSSDDLALDDGRLAACAFIVTNLQYLVVFTFATY